MAGKRLWGIMIILGMLILNSYPAYAGASAGRLTYAEVSPRAAQDRPAGKPSYVKENLSLRRMTARERNFFFRLSGRISNYSG